MRMKRTTVGMTDRPWYRLVRAALPDDKVGAPCHVEILAVSKLMSYKS